MIAIIGVASLPVTASFIGISAGLVTGISEYNLYRQIEISPTPLLCVFFLNFATKLRNKITRFVEYVLVF